MLPRMTKEKRNVLEAALYALCSNCEIDIHTVAPSIRPAVLQAYNEMNTREVPIAIIADAIAKTGFFAES